MENEDWLTRLEKQIIAADRCQEDKDKDAGRKPVELMMALGVRSGMMVADLGAGTGYTAELFSAAVGSQGKVYVQNNAFALTMMEGSIKRSLQRRLENNRLPNVIFWDKEMTALGIANELDLAYLGFNLHDYLHYFSEEYVAIIFENIKTALKPGGILGVADHIGLPGRDNKNLHRIVPETLTALIEKAGFEIEQVSDILADPDDDHSLDVLDPIIYGKTDRVIVRVKKSL